MKEEQGASLRSLGEHDMISQRVLIKASFTIVPLRSFLIEDKHVMVMLLHVASGCTKNMMITPVLYNARHG